MKKTGLYIIAIGAILTLFTGFNFITREKLVDIGSVAITYHQRHNFDWSPLIGIAIMITGTGIYLLGKQNQNTIHISK